MTISISNILNIDEISFKEKNYNKKIVGILLTISLAFSLAISSSLNIIEILKNVVIINTALFSSLFLISPAVFLLLKLFYKKMDFRTSFSILTTSFVYGAIFLLVTLPSYFFIKNIYSSAYFLLSLAIDMLIMFKLIKKETNLSKIKTIIIILLSVVYFVLLFTNIGHSIYNLLVPDYSPYIENILGV